MKPVQAARSSSNKMVLICGKCLRRAKAKPFRKALKHALKGDDERARVRLIDISCLDLCPKRRIVLARPQDLVEGRVMIVHPDDAAGVATLVRADRMGGTVPGSLIDSADGQP